MLKRLAIILSLLVLLLVASLMYIKGKNNINISYISYYVKGKILKIFPNSDVHIENISFSWQQDVHLTISDCKIINSSFIVEIPKLYVDFQLGSLFKISSFKMSAENIFIAETKTKSTTLSLKDLLNVIQKLFCNVDAGSKIELTNLTINRDTNDKLSIDKLYISKKKNLNIHIYAKNDNGVTSDLFATIKNRNNLLNVHGTFYNIKLELLNKLHAFNQNGALEQNTSFKGNFSLQTDKNNKILDSSIQILNTYKEQTTLHDLNINLIYQHGVMSIKEFHFSLKDAYIYLLGKVDFNQNSALFRMDISKLNSKDLCTYIPDSVIDGKLKSWYCDNINGDILNTIVKFNGDITDLTDGSLSNVIITSELENASIKFSNSYEQVEKLYGSLKFQDNNFEVAVDNARFQGFDISNSEIIIDTLNKKAAIYGQALSDIHALYRPIKATLDRVIKIEQHKISGIAKSRFNFQIFNLNLDSQTFLGDISSEIDNLTIDQANVEKHNLNLKLDGECVDLNINGRVNDKPLKFDLRKHNNDISYKFTGDIPTQIFINSEGYIHADIESADINNVTSINGSIDLSDLVLHANYLGWQNNFVDHNKIIFSVRLQDNSEILVEKIDIVGNNVDIRLNGEGNVQNARLYLHSSSFKLPNNDFNIEVQVDEKKNNLVIYGKKINLSDILELLLTLQNNSGFFDNMKVNMSIDNIIMKEEIIIKDGKLDLICEHGHCYGSQFTGQFLQDNSSISIECSEIGLEMHANNAGMFLRSLGISKSIRNGKISFYLSPTRQESDQRYGILSISNFSVKDAPLLATLLSMASMPGIVKALTKEGIYFNKSNVHFLYDDNTGIAKIEESGMEETALCITTSGMLNIKNYEFRLTGQVIPAYSIQKSLFKIPIIGRLLASGKGKGIISIDYKAHGNDKDNNVVVNYISLLAPNLLKRILGIFDNTVIKTQKRAHNHSRTLSKCA